MSAMPPPSTNPNASSHFHANSFSQDDRIAMNRNPESAQLNPVILAKNVRHAVALDKPERLIAFSRQ
jgi:hypothetical protein